MTLTFYWCVLQGETQESRKGTSQVDSDDVEIQQPQHKEQTGIHFMSEWCQKETSPMKTNAKMLKWPTLSNRRTFLSLVKCYEIVFWFLSFEI